MDEVAKFRAQVSVLKQRVEQKQVTAKCLRIYTVHDTRNFTESDEFPGNSAWIPCGVCKSSAQVTVTAKLEELPRSISYELFVFTRLSLSPYPWNVSVLISGSSLLYTESVLRKPQVTYISKKNCTWLLEDDTFDRDTQHIVHMSKSESLRKTGSVPIWCAQNEYCMHTFTSAEWIIRNSSKERFSGCTACLC